MSQGFIRRLLPYHFIAENLFSIFLHNTWYYLALKKSKPGEAIYFKNSYITFILHFRKILYWLGVKAFLINSICSVSTPPPLQSFAFAFESGHGRQHPVGHSVFQVLWSSIFLLGVVFALKMRGQWRWQCFIYVTCNIKPLMVKR